VAPILGHVWVWYCELSDARSNNGFGINPVSYLEIDAWARLMRVRPEPWEVRLLRKIDDAILHEIAVRSERKETDIPVSDVGRVSALFSGIKARQQEAGGMGSHGGSGTSR
jgi:hypothetical protein